MRKVLPIKDYLNKIKKVDDKLFLELYNQGCSDGQIAKTLKLKSRSTSYKYRKKYGLIANNPHPFRERNMTQKELLDRYEKDKKIHIKYMLETPKWVNWKKIYRKDTMQDPRVKKLKYENHKLWIQKNPERAKELNDRYESKERVKEMRRCFGRKYYQRDYVKKWDSLRKKYPNNHPTLNEMKAKYADIVKQNPEVHT